MAQNGTTLSFQLGNETLSTIFTSDVSTFLPDITNSTTAATLNDTECAIFGGNRHLCDVIVTARRVMSIFSLLGSLFVIFLIWLFRKYIVFAQRLILYLSVAACLNCIFFAMGGIYDEGTFCTFQGWGTTMFAWAMLLWVCCMTFNLYMSAIHMTHTERFEWVYHMASWGIPFLLSFLPFTGDNYGPAGTWCWIKNNWAWRFGLWYCPLIIIILLLIVVYSYIVISVNKRVRTWEGLYDPSVDRQKQVLKEDVRPLMAYPFIYLLCTIFPLINRIQNALNPTSPVFGLVLMHTLTSPLPGTLNAIVFALDKDTRSKLTLAQMRMAFFGRHYRSKALILDYPTETIINNQEGHLDYQSTTMQSMDSAIMS